MRGKIVGVSIFLLLSLSVVFAAVGAVSQAMGSANIDGVNGLAMSQYNEFPETERPAEQSSVYNAFTYVCPFH